MAAGVIIYASPFSRTLQTAEAVAAQLGDIDVTVRLSSLKTCVHNINACANEPLLSRNSCKCTS